MKRHTVALSMFAALLAAAPGLHAQRRRAPEGPRNFTRRPAVFEVTTDVVNEDLEAFTVTAGAFGNSLLLRQSGAFEQANYLQLMRLPTWFLSYFIFRVSLQSVS